MYHCTFLQGWGIEQEFNFSARFQKIILNFKEDPEEICVWWLDELLKIDILMDSFDGLTLLAIQLLTLKKQFFTIYLPLTVSETIFSGTSLGLSSCNFDYGWKASQPKCSEDWRSCERIDNSWNT